MHISLASLQAIVKCVTVIRFENSELKRSNFVNVFKSLQNVEGDTCDEDIKSFSKISDIFLTLGTVKYDHLSSLDSFS